ncbi:prolipoprotein diacylglyceryl transferase [Paenibacillus thermotolerans]|uniref:prolipoprotein diacylglyceryl transferase n=1 Tax=Paenibacillus thermotolerans TaxID=3027807 RepID=UPI0023679795|nr:MULTISPECIES: prolipoprotein diacylglyceryl transferase [unclassified Paenibacillus]
MNLAWVLNPIAFRLGSLEVHWYGIILGTAALVGLLLAIQEGKRFRIVPDFFMDLLLLGVPSAIVGARIYYVAFSWQDYKDNPIDIFKIWEGGIAIYGALIGAVVAGYIFIRRRGYNFLRIADICAPSLIVGQMIGRWGNFMNQEAYGGPVSEQFLRQGLHLPNFIVDQMYIEGMYRHPAFLYESVWNLAGLILLLVLRRQSFVRAGEIFFTYIAWYSLGRFFVEGTRIDSLAFTGPDWLASFLNALWTPMLLLAPAGHMEYGNIRVSQLLAVILLLAMIVTMIVRRVKGYADVRYSDPIESTRRLPGESNASADTPQGTNNG